MVTITLYARQQKRHRFVEQSFGLCGRGRRWDPGSPPESVWTVWLQLGLMSLFSQSPPEMQFTSLLSVVKLLVLPNIKMNLPQVYMCSPSWTLNLPPSPYHPSGSSQCTNPEHPVSCIKPGVVIYFTYDNIHVSIPFSQIIPPSPSPTESKRLFYTSVSLLLSHIQGYHYHFPKFHIYVLVYCIGVFLSGLLHSV